MNKILFSTLLIFLFGSCVFGQSQQVICDKCPVNASDYTKCRTDLGGKYIQKTVYNNCLASLSDTTKTSYSSFKSAWDKAGKSGLPDTFTSAENVKIIQAFMVDRNAEGSTLALCQPGNKPGDGQFGQSTNRALSDCLPKISTPPVVAACVDPSNNSDEIIIDLPSSVTDITPKPDWIKSETLWNKIKSWLKNGKKRDDMKGYVKSKYESDKTNNKQCNICGGTETSKTLDAVEVCLDEKKCEEKDGKQLCTPPDKVGGGSGFSFGACVPIPGECNCGIKLNTNVPFIGNCISYSSDDSAGGDGLVVTIANAFPALMGGLSKIVVTLILITSFVTLVIAGVSISTGDAIGVGKGMDLIWKVVTGIALLGASGVILHLINPNFFT